MSFDEMVKVVGETIQKEANAKAVFGEPMKLDTHVLVPVASVVINVGGGGGATSAKKDDPAARFVGGGGGGLTVVSTPLGFLHEKDGQVVFTAIPTAKPAEATLHPLPPMVERIKAAVIGHPS
jgi:uncharacterized spore protein YtfJ